MELGGRGDSGKSALIRQYQRAVVGETRTSPTLSTIKNIQNQVSNRNCKSAVLWAVEPRVTLRPRNNGMIDTVGSVGDDLRSDAKTQHSTRTHSSSSNNQTNANKFANNQNSGSFFSRGTEISVPDLCWLCNSVGKYSWFEDSCYHQTSAHRNCW